MVPSALKSYGQWIVWRLEQFPGEQKPRKVPYNPQTGAHASTTDSATWCDYETAARISASGGYSGLGFVFTAADPFFFLDVDNCSDGAGGWQPHAASMCNTFPGAAVEVSQSGTGLHIVGFCNKPLLANMRNKWRDDSGNAYEFYTSGRFMALGHGFNVEPAADHTATLMSVVPMRDDDHGNVTGPLQEGPRDGYTGPDDDDELISKMLSASDRGNRAADLFGGSNQGGGNVTLRQLWEGDAAAMGSCWPDTGPQGRSFDHSSADAALMAHLAFWTGADAARMERLFARSALGQRDKWKARGDYRSRTTMSAVHRCGKVYDRPTREALRKQNEKIGDAFNQETPKRTAPIMSIEEMLERLVYTTETAGIVDKATLEMYKKEVAKDIYIGSYSIEETGEIKMDGTLKTQKLKHFDAWLSSGDKEIRTHITWKPNAPRICYLPGGQGDGVNVWRGFVPPQFVEFFRDNPDNREQWLQAWHMHLAYLVPDEADRRRFEQWLAHILQKPDELPQTAYLMWTEQTGIGRNWLSSVMVRVLRGYVAANLDIGEVLDGAFNGMLSKKLMAVVDEAKAGADHKNRYQRAEKLKSIINQETRQINVKHGLQSVEFNCMRWLFFSNHPDALPFDNVDRRIWVIKNPDHRASEDYYEWIYQTLDREEFISAVFAHLMYGVDLSSFKPGQHAPMNSAKKKALESMESPLVTAIKHVCADYPADTVATVSMISAALQMEHSVSVTNLNPKTFKLALKSAGAFTIPKDVRINGKKETIIILNSHQLIMENFVNDDGSWTAPDMPEKLRNSITITQNIKVGEN